MLLILRQKRFKIFEKDAPRSADGPQICLVIPESLTHSSTLSAANARAGATQGAWSASAWRATRPGGFGRWLQYPFGACVRKARCLPLASQLYYSAVPTTCKLQSVAHFSLQDRLPRGCPRQCTSENLYANSCAPKPGCSFRSCL